MTHIGITVHNAKTMSDIKIPQNGLFTEDFMLKTSESTVKRTLNSLDDKGYIKRVFKRYADTGKTHREIIFVNAKMHQLKSNYKK